MPTSELSPQLRPTHPAATTADNLLSPRILAYRQASRASETKRAVDKNWRRFQAWCQHLGQLALPCLPATLEAYLVHLADSGLSVASISQAKWAVDFCHRLAGHPQPGQDERVKVILAGIKRQLGSAPAVKQALTIQHLKQLSFEDSLMGWRNKALLYVGFAGGFRRSELAALHREDLEPTPYGLRIRLRRSKTNQEGQGEWVDIVRSSESPHHCPVTILMGWLEHAGIAQGVVFRSVHKNGALGPSLSTVSIGQIVKHTAKRLGFDPAAYGGHSLRSGCATYLLERQVPLNLVARQLRHKRADTTLRYDRNTTGRALQGIY